MNPIRPYRACQVEVQGNNQQNAGSAATCRQRKGKVSSLRLSVMAQENSITGTKLRNRSQWVG
jgi:hypothetical protein